MDKRKWNSYHTCGYTYDVANDQRSAGGVHIYQIRKVKGGWEKRIVQSNGRFFGVGPTEKLSNEDGLSCFHRVGRD